MENNKRHLAHLARKRGVTLGDLLARLAEPTNVGAAASIIRKRIHRRGGRCTIGQAQDRVVAVRDVLHEYREQREVGHLRRELRAIPALPSVTDRYQRQLYRLLGTPGSSYSGLTRWRYTRSAPGIEDIETVVTDGEPYSRRFRHLRQDAVHHISGSLRSIREARRLVGTDRIDGHVILGARHADGSCRSRQVYRVELIVQKSKRIHKEIMFAGCHGAGQFRGYFLAKTELGAKRAIGVANRATRDAEARRDDDRPTRLSGAVCRRWGWCATGIRRWCADHGVSRQVEQRLRAGVRAIAVRRLIARHGGPRDSYERTLIRRTA